MVEMVPCISSDPVSTPSSVSTPFVASSAWEAFWHSATVLPTATFW